MKNNIKIKIAVFKGGYIEYNIFHHFVLNNRLFLVSVDLNNDIDICFFNLDEFDFFEVSYAK